MFRSQQIIIRENVCTSLKLLNYLKTSLSVEYIAACLKII